MGKGSGDEAFKGQYHQVLYIFNRTKNGHELKEPLNDRFSGGSIAPHECALVSRPRTGHSLCDEKGG